MVAAEPANIVAVGLTVSTTVLDTAPHGPAGSSVVRVSVTVPLFPAIGVNITVLGVVVADVLLNWVAVLVIEPVKAVIDQVPLLALPPMVAVLRV